MHPAGLSQLALGGINQRVSGTPLAPGLMPVRVVVPGNRIEGGFESMANGMREVMQDREIEIPPDQFVEPAQGAFTTLAPGARGQFAD